MTARRQNIVRLFQSMGYRHDTYKLFADFCELAALSLSNAVDLAQREGREARYLQIVNGYTREEVELFPRVLAEVTLGLEEGATDLLGAVFHDLELHNKYRGQFFTPFEVCRMMASMIVGSEEDLRRLIEQCGYITACEPACGAGAMVIALAETIRELGINYQHHLHVTAVDVDAKAAHMAYIQFSLLHIPAVVVVGNSLSLEEREHWYTPAHVLGGWTGKLRRERAAGTVEVVEVAAELVTTAPPAAVAAAVVLPAIGQMALF